MMIVEAMSCFSPLAEVTPFGRPLISAGLVLLAVVGPVARAGAPAAPDVVSHPTLPKGLLAWYDFDGNFRDAHGSRHARAIDGKPGFGDDRFGHKNSAFRTIGDAALAVDGVAIGGGSFSIQFWTFHPANWLFGQGERADDHGLHIGFEGPMRCDYWGNNLMAPQNPADGWTHWVVTHDGATRLKTIWRDGKRMAEATTTAYVGHGEFIIGRHFSGGGFYRGSLDDLGIWDRALMADEVAALYADGKGLPYQTAAKER